MCILTHELECFKGHKNAFNIIGLFNMFIFSLTFTHSLMPVHYPTLTSLKATDKLVMLHHCMCTLNALFLGFTVRIWIHSDKQHNFCDLIIQLNSSTWQGLS
jgi:hypothetical protein